jgi:hypothetical protein
VEEGEVGEQAQLRGQVPGDVGAVEVVAGHRRGGGFVEGLVDRKEITFRKY